MSEAGRGSLTPEIVAKAKKLLGVEITMRELRLMPYIYTCMLNEQRIDIRRVNQEEREILSTWRERQWISDPASGMSVRKKFWDAMNEILWLGYVTYNPEASLKWRRRSK